MADIEDAKPKEGQNVDSVTEATPHPADESSAPGPYNDLDVNRPPVSTNDPETPIAHSLVGGAGAPSPDMGSPEQRWEENKEGDASDEAAATRTRGRPKASDES